MIKNLGKEIKESTFDINHTLTQISESSSVISMSTNDIEPPRDYLSVKKSKKASTKTSCTRL